ncbi:MAG: NAD(P)H-hydrate epimerase [Phycisphaerales bacterium]|nr:NAD(P)H-hydrate epimerase [Phycisphaerales bacterium]
MASIGTVLSRSQARAYDAWCTRELGIPGLLLMECAAIGIATEAKRVWERGAGPAPLFVAVCGPGQNGGDGYAAIRHLHSAGEEALALGTAPPPQGSDAAIQHQLAVRLGLVRPFADAAAVIEPLAAARRVVVLDALFGTGLDRPISGVDAVRVLWIRSMRERGARVVAVDIPSGMDCDSGAALGTAGVEADLTVTMVAPKAGMALPAAAQRVGTVVVVPIGGPPVAQFLAHTDDRHTRQRIGHPGAQAQPGANA